MSCEVVSLLEVLTAHLHVFQYFFFSGHRIHHYHQQKPTPLSRYQVIQSHCPIMINIFYSIIHSLKTWQRSRSVLRFFSKLLLSLLLWWLRMWNTAEIDITFSVQRYRIKLVSSTNTWIHKYMNTQIHEYTNTWIHKYINLQLRKWIHKYSMALIEENWCTEVWGHTESQSTLRASVARWKLACRRRQAEHKIY